MVSFDASGSSDQDADTLTYHWDFGDDETVSSTLPTITHHYAEVDNYTVHLRVSDGRGGSDTVSTTVQVVSRQTLHSMIMFGYKQVSLQPSAEENLASLIQQLSANAENTLAPVGRFGSKHLEQLLLDRPRLLGVGVAVAMQPVVGPHRREDSNRRVETPRAAPA